MKLNDIFLNNSNTKSLHAFNIYYYYMANPVLGKSLYSDWFFFGPDFAVRTISMETVQPVYFCSGAKHAILVVVNIEYPRGKLCIF